MCPDTDNILLGESKCKKVANRKLNMNDSPLLEKDPIMKLGYGLTAYRNMMWAMIVVFSLFTILQCPSFVIFSTASGYNFKNEALVGRETYSLGSLGYASVQCSQIPLGVHKIAMSCPYGVIGEIYDLGVNDEANDVDPETCLNLEGYNDQCKPNNPAIIGSLNKTVGETSVGFDFDPNDLWTAGSLGNTVPSSCANPYNNAFIQYSCVMSSSQQNWKYRKLCIVTFFGLLTCGFFAIFIRWLHFKGKLN